MNKRISFLLPPDLDRRINECPAVDDRTENKEQALKRRRKYNMRTMMKELENVHGGAEPEILEQKVVWYDGNGHKYTTVIKTPGMPDIIAQKVTYSDGNGKTYTVEQ